jgi:hypothetical protein
MVESVWRIRGHNGQTLVFDDEMPGNMTEAEICRTLERLASRHLTDKEVVEASLRPGHPRYNRLLERSGAGEPISYGHNVVYTADWKNK